MIRIVVTDANVFIDLIEVGLIDLFFGSTLEVITTELVVRELYDEQQGLLQQHIDNGRLSITSSHIQLSELKFSKGFSEQDISLMTLAYQRKATLLSGERKMIKWCHEHGLPSHGVIWVFDQLIEMELLASTEAADKLELLMTVNEWLPFEVCMERIGKWRHR